MYKRKRLFNKRKQRRSFKRNANKRLVKGNMLLARSARGGIRA
nr:MAG: hypothetical protein [Microvirus sp.]